jgi:TolB-like protein/Flp pilus assembly protein TadD
VGALLVIAMGVGGYFFVRGKRDRPVESVAVLPFENKSGNADSEYLSDGLAESLIYRLSQLSNLKVTPRSSAFRYKGKDVDAEKIGNELGVDAVMSGRLIQRGDDLTISVDLIDVRNKKTIWGEQFQRKMSDLLATQRDIASTITEKLQVRLSGNDTKGISKPYTNDNEAYQLYLKGRFYSNKRNAEALKKSIEYFNQAIEKDPNFALAYAGLSDVYGQLPVYSAGSPRENVPKAMAAARKALEIDESIAEAHSALGFQLFYYEWNVPESNKEFQRAFELNPNYATAYQWYGIWNLASTGRFDEAIAELKRAQELDRLSLIINTNLGESYIYARQYDKAIEQLRKTLELDQSFYRAHWTLGVAYELKASFPEAIAEYQKARALDDDPRALAMLGHAYAISSKRDEALKALDQLKELAKRRYVSPINFVFIYVGLGEKDEAFQWLETCYQERDPQMTRLKVNPLFDPLRSDARFTELMRRVGLP